MSARGLLREGTACWCVADAMPHRHEIADPDYCPRCGEYRLPEDVYCFSCGKQLDYDWIGT